MSRESSLKFRLFTLQLNVVYLKICLWKRRFLLETIIFRFGVKLGDCNHFSFTHHEMEGKSDNIMTPELIED